VEGQRAVLAGGVQEAVVDPGERGRRLLVRLAGSDVTMAMCFRVETSRRGGSGSSSGRCPRRYEPVSPCARVRARLFEQAAPLVCKGSLLSPAGLCSTLLLAMSRPAIEPPGAARGVRQAADTFAVAAPRLQGNGSGAGESR
jgi:hypothetical protein